MGVYIKTYCLVNNNVLSKALQTLVNKSVLMKDDYVEIYKRDGDFLCRLILPYTLSCNDLAEISSVFSGFWWCVSGSIQKCTIVLTINFQDVKV